MNNWSILGIEPTEDKEIIKRAYMTELPKYNPEDDPQGFTRLRLAYENILNEINRKDKLSEEKSTPVDRFMGQLEDIYQDIIKRRDGRVWEELLQDEVCIRLDLVDEAEEKVMTFLMENNILPKKIWILLEKCFDWRARKDLLKETYPPNFIDFILNNTIYEELTDELFQLEPEAKAHHFDRWVRLYYEISDEINLAGSNMAEPDQDKELILEEKKAELEALPLNHIYYQAQLARKHLMTKEAQEAYSLIEPLFIKHPKDSFIGYIHAMALLDKGEPQMALIQFQELLEEDPNFLNGKKGLVDVYVALEDYETAREILLKILEEYPHDGYGGSMFFHVTEKLIELFQGKHQANPEDLEITLELAKHYLNHMDVDSCEQLLESLPKNTEDPRYHQYYAGVFYQKGEFHKAMMEHEILLEKEEKARHYDSQVRTLIALGKLEEALEQIEKGLALEEEDSIITVSLYDQKGIVLRDLGRFEEGLEAFNIGLTINEQAAGLHYNKALTYQRMGSFGEVIDCCERVRFINPFIADAYTLQMETYNGSGMYEQAIAISDLADQVNLDHPRIKYRKAGALRLLGDIDGAKVVIDELLKAEFDDGFRPYFHIDAAHIAEAKGNEEEALTHLKKAIELQPDNDIYQEELGNLYLRQEELLKSFEIFDTLVKKDSNNIYALIGRGNVYMAQKRYSDAQADFEMILRLSPEFGDAHFRLVDSYLAEGLYDKALERAKGWLEVSGSLFDHLEIPYILQNAQRYEEADKAFKQVIERFYDVGKAYAAYGYFLRDHQRIKEAIEISRQGIENDPSYGDAYNDLAYYLQRIGKPEEALVVIEEGWEKDLGNRGVLAKRRGEVYSFMKHYEEAIESMKEALEFQDQLEGLETLAGIYDGIAVIYECNLNDPHNALEYYTKAYEEDSKYPNTLMGLGDLYYYYFKDYPKAIEHYTKKIEVKPEEADAYLSRGIVLKALGEKRAAKKDFKKALELRRKEEAAEKLEKGTLCPVVYEASCYRELGKVKLAKKGYLAMLVEPHRKKSWCPRTVCDTCYYGLGQLAEIAGNLEEALDYYEKAISLSNSVIYNETKKNLLEKMKSKRL